MANKSNTVQSLRAELESVDTAIEKYTRVRKALVEVITFMGNEELHDLMGTPNKAEHEEEESKDGKEKGLPSLPQDGIEAVRKALAARNQT